MTTKRYYGILLLICAAGLITRAVHFNTPMGVDDGLYRTAAKELFAPHLSGLSHEYYARSGVRVILWGWFRIAGKSLEANAVLLFVMSAASLWAFAEACRSSLGGGRALVAATIYWLHPIAILYDVALAAEAFVLPFLFVSLALFQRYASTLQMKYMLAAALAVGAAAVVKEYYILMLLPYTLWILRHDPRARPWARVFVLLTCAVVTAAVLDVTIHFLDSGDWLAHIRPFLDYSERLQARDHVETSHLKQILRTCFERGVYFEILLLDYGIAGGILLVAGWLYLFLRQRDPRLSLPFVAGTMFFLFLSLTPVGLRPLRFVEWMPRYALVFMPFFAIGAGCAIGDAFESLARKEVRRVGAATLGIICLVNCSVPNTLIDRARILECKAIRGIVRESTSTGLSVLVCPWVYKNLIPDEIMAPGVTLKYAMKPDVYVWDAEFGDIPEEFLAASDHSFFVPAASTRSVTVLAPGQPNPPSGSQVSDPRKILAEAGFRARELWVPETSAKAWGARLGLPVKGKLVGWSYSKSPVPRNDGE